MTTAKSPAANANPNEESFERFVRWSYDQLILQQPHLQFDGLWKLDSFYYAVCIDLPDAKAADRSDLVPWFNNKCRVITAPIRVVPAPPDGAERIVDTTAEDRSFLRGAPRTLRDLLVELSILIPRDFPAFSVKSEMGTVEFVTARKLNDPETVAALTAYRKLGNYPPLQFIVDSALQTNQESFRSKYRDGDMALVPGRHAPRGCGKDLVRLMERDEDFWASARGSVLGEPRIDTSNVLPNDWKPGKTFSCLVDASIGTTHNLRTYLSLYNRIILVPPLENHFDKTCATMGVTKDELATLVGLGKVRLLVPQSVDRYDISWMSTIAEQAPQGLMMSRRLAAATVMETRRRAPFLYLPLGPSERHAVLHTLTRILPSEVTSLNRDRAVALAAEIGGSWAGAEWSIHDRGAMGTQHLGIGLVAAAIYEQITGRDLRLELWDAARKVEWAAIFGAHVFQSTGDTYNESATCDLVASLYGAPRGTTAITLAPEEVLSTIDSLLSIDNKVPIIPFATEFSSADIDRLRDLVFRITRENVDQDFLRAAIEKFNAEVRHYERRPDQVKSINIVGFISAAAVAGNLVDGSIRNLLPLVSVFAAFVMSRLLEELPSRNAAIGTFVDLLNSVLTARVKPEAVLVARAKKQIKILKG